MRHSICDALCAKFYVRQAKCDTHTFCLIYNIDKIDRKDCTVYFSTYIIINNHFWLFFVALCWLNVANIQRTLCSQCTILYSGLIYLKLILLKIQCVYSIANRSVQQKRKNYMLCIAYYFE